MHDACHHAPDVADARRADLGDDVVDDLLELLLGERLRHELLEHLELVLLVLGLLLAPARAECLRRLDAPLPLALEHLQLLVVRERALELLLRVPKRVEDQAERVATVRVAREPRRLELVLDPLDEAHAVLLGERRREPAGVDSPAEHVPVEVEDRLPGARTDVDEHAVVLEPGRARRRRRRIGACAPPRRPETRRRP